MFADSVDAQADMPTKPTPCQSGFRLVLTGCWSVLKALELSSPRTVIFFPEAFRECRRDGFECLRVRCRFSEAHIGHGQSRDADNRRHLFIRPATFVPERGQFRAESRNPFRPAC